MSGNIVDLKQFAKANDYYCSIASCHFAGYSMANDQFGLRPTAIHCSQMKFKLMMEFIIYQASFFKEANLQSTVE